MVQLDYGLFDADNHYYEPTDCFTRHLDKATAREAIAWVEVKGRTKLAVCGTITDYIPNPTFEVVAVPGSLVDWHRGINPGGKTIREIFTDGGLEPCQRVASVRGPRVEPCDERSRLLFLDEVADAGQDRDRCVRPHVAEAGYRELARDRAIFHSSDHHGGL